MKARILPLSFCVGLLFSGHAFAYTGCPGDTNIVAEYIFHDGAYNTGSDDGIGDLILTNGVTFSTDVPPPNADCGFSASLPATGSGGTTPALETAGSYDPLAGATQFVIMAWVKRESASSNNNTSARIVSDTSALAGGDGFEFRFSGANGTLALRINGTELSTTVGGIAPNSNAWHHVAVVYDGTRPATNALTRHAHFYVDGVQRGLGVSNATVNVSVNANTNRLTVGNSSVGRGVNNLLVGKIDDVRILRGFAPVAVGDGKTNEIIFCYVSGADDFIPPTISCPADIVVTSDLCEAYASSVNLGLPSTEDQCAVAEVVNDAPSLFPIGLTMVVWQVLDFGGNTATCTQQVTVIDNRNLDSDSDGIPDCWELQQSLNPNDPTDANQESTHPWAHGLTNLQVYQNPSVLLADNYSSADDGIPDWWKVKHGLSISDFSIAGDDSDGDGFSNFEEHWMGTNPRSSTEPATLFVDVNHKGNQTGTSERPFKKIQSAINAASPDQITAIRVRPGTYPERLYINGKAYIHIFSDEGPATTIIDGEHVDSSVVRFYNFSKASLVGFGIQNASTDWMGAGLRIEATNGIIQVADSVIVGNVTRNSDSSGGGGGIYVKTAAGSKLLNNIIGNNSARRGGGVLFAGGNVEFKYNTVLNNVATAGLGGGLSAIQGTQPDIQYNAIWGNIGSNQNTQVHQLTISNNVVEGGAPGVNNQQTGPPDWHQFRTDTRIRAPQWRLTTEVTPTSTLVCRTLPMSTVGTITDCPTVSFGNVVKGKTYLYTASGCVQWKFPSETDLKSSDPDGYMYKNPNCVRTSGAPKFSPGQLPALGPFWCVYDIFATPIKVFYAFSAVGYVNNGPCIQFGKRGLFQPTDSGTLTLRVNCNPFCIEAAGAFDACIQEVEVVLDKCPEDFLPKGGDESNSVKIKASVTDNTLKGKFRFTLYDVSKEPGYCMNAPRKPKAQYSASAWDLEFATAQGVNADFDISGSNRETATTKRNDLTEIEVTVTNRDYGAYGKIKVEFLPDGIGPVVVGRERNGSKEFTNIPLDDNDNHIADAAPQDKRPDGSKGLPEDDCDDTPTGNGIRGDRLTRYEEYRGFMVNGAHVRTDPTKKEVFYNDASGQLPQDYWTHQNLGAPILKIKKDEMSSDAIITINQRSHSGPRQRAIMQVENPRVSSREDYWGITAPRSIVGPNLFTPWNIRICHVYSDAQRWGIRSGSKLVTAISASAETIVVERANDQPDDFWTINGKFNIEGEIIPYSGVVPGNNTFTFTGCVRGEGKQAHGKGKLVHYFVNPEEVTRHAVAHEAGHAVGIQHDAAALSLMTSSKAGQFLFSHEFRHEGSSWGSTQEFTLKAEEQPEECP